MDSQRHKGRQADTHIRQTDRRTQSQTNGQAGRQTEKERRKRNDMRVGKENEQRLKWTLLKERLQ